MRKMVLIHCGSILPVRWVENSDCLHLHVDHQD